MNASFGTEITKKLIWTLPTPVDVGELRKAVNAATWEYKELWGQDPMHDDWLTVQTEDENVVLWFEVPGDMNATWEMKSVAADPLSRRS